MTGPKRPAQVVAIACASLIALVATPAGAGSRIVNGLTTHDFPTTGALLYSGSGGADISSANASTWCSGTLIGCQTFLTAAHCVADDETASHYWVFLQNGGIATVSSVTTHPSYNPNFSSRDVAIVHLNSPVTGIDPTTINSTHDLGAMPTGVAGTIAGFGRTGGGSDYGLKRFGEIVTADCNTGETAGEGNDLLVCWDYDMTVGAPGDDSNTCNGDSGGPLFMEFPGSTELVGVTSAGTAVNCGPGDHSWDASVFYNASWIQGFLDGDSTDTCGSLLPVGDPAVTVFGNDGTLNASNQDDSFSLHVPAGANLVRFAFNGIDIGLNPNFFVKEGAGASAADFDCKEDAATSYGACEFADPAEGTWSVFVQRGSGSGGYQVTTTVFTGEPPVCGNDTIEGSEVCDGSELGSCPIGPCVACACPAPVCSNNIVEDGEECDGSSDLLCPGQCLGDCTCEEACTDGNLYGLSIRSDDVRFGYKGLLNDPSGMYPDLDPRDAPLTLEVDDGSGAVSLTVPTGDIGWIKADTIKRKFGWKGDGSNNGLRRVKLAYKTSSDGDYWSVLWRGKYVAGSANLDVSQVLDFTLAFDGTCHLESW